MKALLDLLRDLVLLRRGPQDVPFSTGLLAAILVAGMALDFALLTRLDDPGRAAPQVGLSALLSLLLPWAALSIAGKRERFIQTATALAGVGIVFTLLMVPAVLGVGPAPQPTQEPTSAQLALSLLYLVLVGWALAARGNILRHALETSLPIGVLVAVVFFAVEVLLTAAMFGGTS
jgi:hypothetical protein